MIATHSNINPKPFAWLTLAALAAVLVLLAVGAIAHADLRHGAEAEMARTCADNPQHMFFNPATGRTALVCLTPEGKFGLVILDERGKEVTAFIKNKLRSFDQVVQYLRNTGYGPIN